MSAAPSKSAELDVFPPIDPETLAENEKAWEEEALRIAAEIDAGRMELIPWEEVREQVFGKKK
jgi:hypothetical protein